MIYMEKKNVSGRANNITSMKFKKGNNERIYCKEFFKQGKKSSYDNCFIKEISKNYY